MKKFIFLLLGILFFFCTKSEGVYFLKLRAAHNPEYLRIVLEGDESDIREAIVNQKGSDIRIKFPHGDIIMSAEKEMIPYRIDKSIILLSPGAFKSFKVFTLRNPGRLVIDVYPRRQEKETTGLIERLRNKWRESAQPFFRPEAQRSMPRKKEVQFVVIDPGHGGYETGIVTDKHIEKNVVLDIARMLGSLINRGQRQGFLTRESDQFMSLGERTDFAHGKRADIFLSIHIGNHPGTVLYTPVIAEQVPYEIKKYLFSGGQEDYLGESLVLRDIMRQTLREDFNAEEVSSVPLPYSILSDIEAAALLIELPSFAKADYTENYRIQMANTIYRALSSYGERSTD